MKTQVPSCSRIHYSRFAFRAFPASHPGCTSCRSSQCTIVFGLSLESMFFPMCHFRTVGHSYSSRGELLTRSTVFLGPNSPDEFPLSPCYFCTAGQFPAGGSRLPPGSVFPLGPFLHFLAALRGQIPDPKPLPRFS
jgi:hypothetical protein